MVLAYSLSLLISLNQGEGMARTVVLDFWDPPPHPELGKTLPEKNQDNVIALYSKSKSKMIIKNV